MNWANALLGIEGNWMKITLTEWALRNYAPSPSIHTLRAWVASGQIYPAPERVGRMWMVDERATRVALPDEMNLSAISERARYILKAI